MIENYTLTTSIGTVFTAPGNAGDLNVQSAITTMIFCNVLSPDTTPPIDETTNTESIEVFLVKAGGTASATTNAIIKDLAIPGGETVFFDTERIVLGPGDSIQARATANNAIVCTVSVLPV
jgi:hypothetical protein